MKWQLAVKIKTDLLTEYLIHIGYRDYSNDVLGLNFRMLYRKIADDFIYYNLDDEKKFRNLLAQNPFKIIPLIIKRTYEQSKKLIKLTKQINQKPVEKLSNNKLNSLFNQFAKEYSKAFSPIQTGVWMENFLTALIKEEFNKKIDPLRQEVQFQKAFSDLTISSKKTEALKEEENLLRIASLIKQKKNLRNLFLKTPNEIQNKFPELSRKLDNQIKNHLKKFSYIKAHLLQDQPYEFNNLIQRLKEALEENPKLKLKKLQNQQIKNERNFKNTAKKLKISGEFLKLVNLMRQLIYFRTARIEWLNLGCFYIRPLLEEIARRIDLKYDELIFLLPKEISEFLESGKKVNYQAVKERMKKYALVMERGKIRLYVGRKVNKLIEKEEVPEKEREIKGMIACPGKVSGRVKIVMRRNQINKIEKGDILVTTMTTPDYVIAMKKVAAIITDLGGVTSHAAIVSRELGIPCIIGTKIATKVLKDGDLVEVDTNRGVVRKI